MQHGHTVSCNSTHTHTRLTCSLAKRIVGWHTRNTLRRSSRCCQRARTATRNTPALSGKRTSAANRVSLHCHRDLQFDNVTNTHSLTSNTPHARTHRIQQAKLLATGSCQPVVVVPTWTHCAFATPSLQTDDPLLFSIPCSRAGTLACDALVCECACTESLQSLLTLLMSCIVLP
jgi:hypothetical protein